MMKHILIPVDFSEQSWQAALCALNLYKNAGVRFYLFFSEEHDYCKGDSDVITQAPLVRLSSWVKKLELKKASGQVLIPLKWEGEFIADVRSAVSENQIDLIVMSTRYPNIFCEELSDSHVRHIIARVKCPVLIVPRDFSCFTPQQVVLLTDYNFKHRTEATNHIKEFVNRTRAHLNVLQLSKKGNALTTAQQANKSILKGALDSIQHSFHFVIQKTMDEALQFFIDVQQVDMVILFAKNINLSENILFSPSLHTEMDYHKNIPFLIVHE